MKKIISLLLLIGAVIFIGFFAYTTYQYYTFLHSDDPIDPYLSVTSGNATIVRGNDLAIDMGSGEVYEVRSGDIIITRDDSFAVIHFPDHSVTRIGEKGRLTINTMEVSRDYSKIEVDITIEQGKIWNRVVRTIYPGSFFRVNLPTGGIIAGVRGTTFDVNLELSYIRAVDHSVALQDSLGRTVSLLPGEAVNAKNILEKVSSTVRDAVWTQLNGIRDMSEVLLREESLEKNLMRFREGYTTQWDRFVRWVLGKFDTFKGLKVVEMISNDQLSELIDVPDAVLLEWYQRFQDKKFIQERENLRLLISERIKTNTSLSPYIESFARSALWDSMSFSGMNLESAKTLLESYTESLDERIKNVLNVVPISDLESKARETLRSLVQ